LAQKVLHLVVKSVLELEEALLVVRPFNGKKRAVSFTNDRCLPLAAVQRERDLAKGRSLLHITSLIVVLALPALVLRIVDEETVHR
jgi:hypothetical protein